eukprot:99868-Amphidinium_carterae.1
MLSTSKHSHFAPSAMRFGSLLMLSLRKPEQAAWVRGAIGARLGVHHKVTKQSQKYGIPPPNGSTNYNRIFFKRAFSAGLLCAVRPLTAWTKFRNALDTVAVCPAAFPQTGSYCLPAVSDKVLFSATVSKHACPPGHGVLSKFFRFFGLLTGPSGGLSTTLKLAATSFHVLVLQVT